MNIRGRVTQPINYKECFEALELTPGAPYQEVRAAYMRLKDLYAGDSIVLTPLEDELRVDWKETVLNRIEEAYRQLSELYSQGGPELSDSSWSSTERGSSRVDEDLRAKLDAVEVFSGEALRHVRELLRLEIHEVALVTKINKQHLKNLEDENYSALPEEVFLRGYLSSCARLYTLDPGKVVGDYLGRFRAWKQSG